MARIAVRVTAGDHPHRHRPRRLEAAAVADRVAGLDLLDADALGAQRHGRQQAVLLGRTPARGAAVQHDAGADPVVLQFLDEFGLVQHPARIRQAALAFQAVRAFAEAPHLLADRQARMLELVGVGEVRHQGDVADARDRAQARVRGAKLVGPEAEPVHTGVHLQLHVDRPVQARIFEHPDLLDAVHRAVDVVLGQQRDVGCIEDSLKQQDRLDPAQFAQAQRIFRLDQGQSVGLDEAAHAAGQAMAIGIRLDHRPDFRRRCAGTRLAQVMVHGLDMDGGVERAWHGDTDGDGVKERKTYFTRPRPQAFAATSRFLGLTDLSWYKATHSMFLKRLE